jgi:hypothetical protein
VGLEAGGDVLGDLPPGARDEIEDQKNRQRSILALSDDEAAKQMVTWVGRTDSRVFAAIGSSKLIVWSQAEHHSAQSYVKLLATFGREGDEVVFLQPLLLATD